MYQKHHLAKKEEAADGSSFQQLPAKGRKGWPMTATWGRQLGGGWQWQVSPGTPPNPSPHPPLPENKEILFWGGGKQIQRLSQKQEGCKCPVSQNHPPPEMGLSNPSWKSLTSLSLSTTHLHTPTVWQLLFPDSCEQFNKLVKVTKASACAVSNVLGCHGSNSTCFFFSPQHPPPPRLPRLKNCHRKLPVCSMQFRPPCDVADPRGEGHS